MAAAEATWEGAGEAGRQAQALLDLMAQGHFLPNSPILMNTGRPLGRLAACFVLLVEDSLESIFEAVKETALIHKSGGGTGFSFSRLRSVGDLVASTNGVSSGPVSFMNVFDVATEAIKQGGTSWGANMGMLSVSHPDIELFVTTKRRPGVLLNFNLSVVALDAFHGRGGRCWPLVNPNGGKVVREIEAGRLVELMVEAAHALGETGLAFYDAINRANSTPTLGVIEATNPCGEQTLLPYEACNLGSLVL